VFENKENPRELKQDDYFPCMKMHKTKRVIGKKLILVHEKDLAPYT
jgi:hypothetical protein